MFLLIATNNYLLVVALRSSGPGTSPAALAALFKQSKLGSFIPKLCGQGECGVWETASPRWGTPECVLSLFTPVMARKDPSVLPLLSRVQLVPWPLVETQIHHNTSASSFLPPQPRAGCRSAGRAITLLSTCLDSTRISHFQA